MIYFKNYPLNSWQCKALRHSPPGCLALNMNHTRISASASVAESLLFPAVLLLIIYIVLLLLQIFICQAPDEVRGVVAWPPRHLSPDFLGSLFNCGLKW